MRPSRQLRRPLIINKPEFDDERSLVRIAGALEGIESSAEDIKTSLEDVVDLLYRRELSS